MNEIITLKLPLYFLALATDVDTHPVHLIVQPHSFVVAAVSPQICTSALSFAVTKLSFVPVRVSEYVFATAAFEPFHPLSVVNVAG